VSASQWEHPVVLEVRAMLGDTLARWWLDEYPGRMTVARAAWVLAATDVLTRRGEP
jgi:hypothetical protein